MSSAAAEPIKFLAYDCAFGLLLMIALCLCFRPERENADQRAAPASAGAAPAVQMAAAAAPVVRLRYFPYSTVGRRASEKLVCAICLETFQHGESCGEVPACRHFFHAACVDLWRKSSVTCPLCRGYMAATASSERAVSAGDDMV